VSIVILLSVLTLAFARAAEPIPTEDGQAGSAAAADPAPDTPPPQDNSSAAPPSEDVFKPTEEISEDFAVPFPVDI
jgi:hypothetical protein